MRLLAREDVAQLLELGWIVTPLTQVRFPAAARDFCPRVNFQCRLSYRVRTPPCAIACINICVHVKDPVVHVRVWWITETLKHSACTVGWEVQPCCGWPSPGKATQISHGKIPLGQYSCKKFFFLILQKVFKKSITQLSPLVPNLYQFGLCHFSTRKRNTFT